MSKRLLTFACAAALLAAACSDIPEGEVVPGEGPRFVVTVADAVDNVGLGNAVAVGADGVPFYSYLIFAAELAEGEIPAQRPIGAPYIQAATIAATDTEPAVPGKFGAAVGVGSVSSDGIFTRGAAAQVRDAPGGVTVPYGPATVEALIGQTAASMNGTDIALDATGGMHVVWAAGDGIYYADGGAETSFSAQQIFDYGLAVRKAGPIGRPSVTTDADGNPWIAYTVDAQGERVEVATGSGDRFTTETVADLEPCDGCPQPLATQIGVTADGPAVAYIDPADGSVSVATRTDAGTWTPSVVADGVNANGLAMTVDADGNGIVTFYDGGSVQMATQDGAAWSLSTVADVDLGEAAAGTGNFAPTTGVAVDDQGTRYVTYMDAGTVKLSSSPDGQTFSPIETGALGGAAFPAVAVTPDGAAIYVTWYDDEGQLLKLGIQADIKDLAIAAPSPTSDVVAPPTGGGDCGKDKTVALDLVTPGGTVFDTGCLVAPSGDPFTINYDNQAAGITHNVDVFTEEGGDSIAATALEAGPVQQTLDLDALDPGDYFFHCDAHPDTMFGTLAVVNGAKG